MNLEQYRMSTGYYDEGAILQAAGVDERNARFADIFGDVQGANDISPEWQALLDEARRRNAEMLSATQTANDAAILTALTANDWPALVALGAARRWRDEDCMRYELTGRGLELQRGSYRPTTGDYADQAGIDEEPF